jgi:hypothetical protein
MTIAGKFIPGNVHLLSDNANRQTTVSVATWAIMHDERNFSHPNDFIPERWIPSECGKETCNKAAWIPFSHGLRGCIGRPYIPVGCANMQLGTGRIEDDSGIFYLEL